MKTTLKILGLLMLVSPLAAQNLAQNQDNKLAFLERDPIYDYTELNLNNTDTIPGFAEKSQKLKITGTIFLSDGVTPAENVLLYIYQHNEDGKFDYQMSNEKKYINHRGWIKTDADGQYTFYTFVPGEAIVPLTYPRRVGPKQIYPVVKVEGEASYNLPAFMFEGDELITKSCIKRLKRKGIDCILSPEESDGMLVAKKDIVLSASNPKS